jgi:hypothetical protein
MIYSILQYFFPAFTVQFSNIFYIGKKRTPIALKKDDSSILVKLGSGFASYTLQSDKEELRELVNFVENFLDRNQ